MSDNIMQCWQRPATVCSPPRKGNKRRRNEEWEPYKQVIVNLRKKGDTAEQIRKALADEGFPVDLTALRRKLRDWEPKYNKSEASFKIEMHAPVGISSLEKQSTNQSSTPVPPDGVQRFLKAADAPVPANDLVNSGQYSIVGDIPGAEDDLMNLDLPDDGDTIEETFNSKEDQISQILISLSINLTADDDGTTIMMEIFGDGYEANEDIHQVAKRVQLSLTSPAEETGDKTSQTTTDASSNPISASNAGWVDSTPECHIEAHSEYEADLPHAQAQEGRYSLEKLLAIVEDLPNWYIEGPTASDLYSKAHLVVRDMMSTLLSDRQIDEVMRHRLTGVSEALFSTLETRYPLTMDLRPALTVLDELGETDIRVCYIKAFLYSVLGQRMLIHLHYDEAQVHCERAQLEFRSCTQQAAFPAPWWFRGLRFLLRLHLVYLSGLTSAEREPHIAEIECLLWDAETASNSLESDVKLRILSELLKIWLEFGQMDYLPVLERLLESILSRGARMSPTYTRGIAGSLTNLLCLAYDNTNNGVKNLSLIARYFERCGPPMGGVNDFEILSRLAYCLSAYRQQHAQARAIYRYLIQTDPSCNDSKSYPLLNILFRLSATFFYESRFVEALQLLDRVINSFSQDSVASRVQSISSRSPTVMFFYNIVYLPAEQSVVEVLRARGLVLYAQPVVENMISRYRKQYYDNTGDDDTWGAILRGMDTSSILQLLPLLPPIPV